MTRKILVVTGSRAEFGLLKPLLYKIKKDPDLILQIIATGMHLSKKYGLTVNEIHEAGFETDLEIDLMLEDDSDESIAKSIAIGMTHFMSAYKSLSPDLIIILGDRFEILPVAISALIGKVPVAHIHGGEKTEAAYDEAIRHSITKMSHIHFAANEEYRKRIIQLGESPETVFNVGGLGVDAIKEIKLLTKEELEKSLKLKFLDKNLIITFHPVTLNQTGSEDEVKELLSALKDLKETSLIFTMPNADSGNAKIFDLIEGFVYKNNNAYAFKSLGQLRYFSCMSLVDGVVGNSSSGLLEAPTFKIGTINIGDRQKGRLQAGSVLNCTAKKNKILESLSFMYSEKFQSKLKNVKNPYGDGGASIEIVNTLKEIKLEGIIKKTFYDLV
ncbi:UDP-N-acetylglucosamine 2-epimerase [Gammaproteobacteria bacterium]|nr:UDP-N-acetylglucosamine 2-epimerase [Gammaproteobacteria bacterium]MDC1112666.1 UDP-N-acetylglucosamine 2-epimerase [bacterium]MDC3228868.1 UDP-N-acetylglucosamine 2-epimerase [Gammaproteobacteria bacterium]